MKRIIGLDLGVASMGWAVVDEAQNSNETSSIIDLGVRVNPLTVDEQTNFEKGKSITTNATRQLKHGARLNLYRYKIRRDLLISTLISCGFISEDSILTEDGPDTTFETYRLRSKAVSEEISLPELARVFLAINKKRGYKSSRKSQSAEDGTAIDSIDLALELYNNNLTPGQYVLQRLSDNKKVIPSFYKSDLQSEFDRIYKTQSKFNPQLLTKELYETLIGCNERQTWAIISKALGLKGLKRATKGISAKVEEYQWRVSALSEKIDFEQLAIVLSKINSQIANSSGYLGSISDRSKILHITHQTVGQYQLSELENNPHHSLRNEVFYRQDYLDEFERIWECQASFHKEMTPELKQKIRDIIIFYQRPLKSQKSLVSFCKFESSNVSVIIDGKTKIKRSGLKVAPKSSPVFQEFKIWQLLNNVTVESKVENTSRVLSNEERLLLHNELSWKDYMSKTEALKLLGLNPRQFELNYEKLEGNNTNASLLKAYYSIIDITGHDASLIEPLPATQKIEAIATIFSSLGINTDILNFNCLAEGKELEDQPAYHLWHMLYSYEDDDSTTGNDTLINSLMRNFGFNHECATLLANVTFQQDYGSLSTKAMRRIIPYLMKGMTYDKACGEAGYEHSERSLTREELAQKELVSELTLLPNKSLRNPVVEKILNQMINVINNLIAKYGQPDEIRVELARELKKSAKDREEMTSAINRSTIENEKLRERLKTEFKISNPSRNDVIRLRLYEELRENGYHTLYSNTYIPREELFSGSFDIEHIIPQASLFDDSFSNKTIELRSVNLKKGNATAVDFIADTYGEAALAEYKSKVEALYKKGVISKGKYAHLLMTSDTIPEDFINRDLCVTQYISRKACEILEKVATRVTVTTGSITDRLRDDWGLTNIMQELNWDKYDRLGMTESFTNRDGKIVKRISGWTKRNDHRHHAMDALTVAFTKSEYVQYLNNLNAQSDKGSDIYAIRNKYLERDKHNNLRFKTPIPEEIFRKEAKLFLEKIFVSFKAKNKVVTLNTNVTDSSKGKLKKVQLTPRGQLHNETIYGCIERYDTREEKINASFNAEKIATVASPVICELLMRRLNEFGNDPKKAFTGKNSLEKNPIYTDSQKLIALPDKVKTVTLTKIYTIRKEISPDLKIDKVIDKGIQEILQARLDAYNGDAKKAFSNLDDDPIYLNKEKGITIKRVTIKGPNEVESLHAAHDHFGNTIVDENGMIKPADFVSTSNNHHIAIYKDANGNLQERVVSFFEATARACAQPPLPIINREYNADKGWTFLFTLKRNEYFVFPKYEERINDEGETVLVKTFDPNEIDILDPNNYQIISPNLFRVQKIASKDYFFRHHLETTVECNKELKDVTWKRITSIQLLSETVKVHVNNIGKITNIGEF